MNELIVLLIVGSTIWVGIDASNLGIRRGRLAGSALDMSVASWVICCFLLWLVAFPCYLVARGKYVAMKSAPMTYGHVAQWGGAPQRYMYPPPQGYATTQAHQMPQQYAPVPAAPMVAPPQLSPDGMWWWDGRQWTAVPSPATS